MVRPGTGPEMGYAGRGRERHDVFYRCGGIPATRAWPLPRALEGEGMTPAVRIENRFPVHTFYCWRTASPTVLSGRMFPGELLWCKWHLAFTVCAVDPA